MRLLEICIQTLRENEEQGGKVIKSINELIEGHPKLYRKQIEDLFVIYKDILLSGFAVPTKALALNGISLMCILNSSSARRSKSFDSQVISAVLLLTTFQRELPLEKWQEISEDEENISSSDLAPITLECLQKIAPELGKYMNKIIF